MVPVFKSLVIGKIFFKNVMARGCEMAETAHFLENSLVTYTCYCGYLIRLTKGHGMKKIGFGELHALFWSE